jgi:predicted HTH domain antitoxin
MEVVFRIPDAVASRLTSSRGDIPRQALEALALEGYRKRTLTVLEVSQMLGLSRIEAEDFLGHHQVPLADLEESDLERETALLASRAGRTKRNNIRRRPPRTKTR